MSEGWAQVDAYLSGLLVEEDAALEAALADSRAAGLPEIQVAPNQGRLLQVLALALGARRILEVGTLGGYSTIWLARGLAPGGRLISLEYSERHAAVARGNLRRAGLAELVEVRVGPAQDTLPQLVAEGAGPFDLVFLDADKPGYTGYLEWALRMVRPGSLIVADNVVRAGRVGDPESQDADVLGVRRFLERLAAEPRLRATAIQTVGSKGHDGLALAVVTEA